MSDRDFAYRHEEYRAQQEAWSIAWDFYRGGDRVLRPGRAVRKVSFAQQADWIPGGPQGQIDEGGTSSDAQRRRVRYVEYNAKSYLESHIRESHQQYLDRVSRATHLPLFRFLVDTYASATLRTAPRRGDGAEPAEPWRTYWDDVDLAGDGIDAFVRKALTLALAFGKVFAVTDYTAADTPAASRYHQRELGQRAYSYLVTPLDVVDWLCDEHGLVWIVIREDAPQAREPGVSPSGETRSRYRAWYRDRWELWEDRSSGGSAPAWALVAGGLHPVGEVPVSVLFARRSVETRFSLEADSLIASAVSADMCLFNLLSLFHEQLYGQVFAQTWIPGDGSGSALAALDVGVGVACEYDGQHGQPMMLAPPPALLDIQGKIIQQHIDWWLKLSGTSRGKSENSKEERSAQALSVEYTDRDNQVASLAEHCEEFDRQLHWHVAKWEGIASGARTMADLGAIPWASYSRSVSLQTTAEQIANVVALGALQLPHEVKQKLIKPLVVRLMREFASTEEDVAEAQAAIDAMEEAVEPTNPAGPLPGDGDGDGLMNEAA